MEVCNELKKLSKRFKKFGYKLYIVGGFVRDHLIGLKSDDIDITSNLSTDKVIEICKDLGYKTSAINKHLGTIQIRANSFKFEYTQFRKESYRDHGTHTPDSIEFVDDINIDALRRDFTINSIYYDIEDKSFVDPCNGKTHIESKIIQTTREPSITLADDGLRILRAIRFASFLNFKIERKTLSALKSYTPLLKKISKERILKELNSIVTADLKYNKFNNIFLKLCNKLKLNEYIFNSSLSRAKKFSKKDIQNYYTLDKDSRLIGFYILILKNYFRGYIDSSQLGYSINMLLGIDGIKESSSNIAVTEKIYRIYQNITFDKDILNASVNYLTLSDSERLIIDTFLAPKGKLKLNENINFIKDNNLPLNIHGLNITSKDLIDLGIDNRYISKILSTLYNQVLNMAVSNTTEDLKKLAKDIHETFEQIKESIK